MQLLMNLNDELKQNNQALFPLNLRYHGPKGRFKIIHQGLMIPNLPEPLHFLSFSSLIGQPNVPMLRNQDAIQTTALDTVAVITSTSPHMVGHFSRYSLEQDCQFNHDDYCFGDKERLYGSFPHFRLMRDDNELSVNLDIETKPVISHFNKMKLGLFEHWSLLCACKGEVIYKGQMYSIDQLGSFEYAKAINIPYLPLCFFTYQIINLKNKRQLLLMQIRNNFNQIIQSKIYIRDLNSSTSKMFDENVHFKVHRVYPQVTTPNHQQMYLPREFEWNYVDKQTTIRVCAESRGDFKFGLAAGYVGSFNYQVIIDGEINDGQAGYCEYIDCRPLKWQESQDENKIKENLSDPVPFSCKK